MIIDIAKIISGLGMPCVLGYLVVEAILSKKVLLESLEKMAIAYGVGVGLLSLLMLFLGALKIKFSLLNIASPLILIVIFLLIWNRSHKDLAHLLQEKRFTMSLLDKLSLGFILIFLLYLFFQTLITPLFVWDSWAIWGFKSKAFYFDQGLSFDFFRDAIKGYAHLNYPLLIPLLESWVYFCLGAWNDQLVKIIFPLYFLSLGIVFYYSLRYFNVHKTAFLFVLFLLTIPGLFFSAGNGYADLPFSFYYFTSFMFLLRGFRDSEKRFLYLSALLAGLAAWTKNEGQVICLSNSIIFLIQMLFFKQLNRRNFFLWVEYVSIIFLIILPWFLFKLFLGLSNDVINTGNLTFPHLFSHLQRIPVILTAMGRNVFSINSWNFLWVLSLYSLIFCFKKMIKPPSLFIAGSVILYLCVVVFIYIISPFEINWHMRASLERVLSHIVPLLLFLNVLTIAQEKE